MAEAGDQPELLSEETIYTGRIFSVKQVALKMDGGTVVKRDIVDHHGSVGILPVNSEGEFVLVRQFRAPARATLLELPAGTLEPGEDPDECAQRELAEEIGFRAGKLRRLAGFYLAPGWATEFMHGYLATDLSPATADGDEDEDIEIVTLRPEEALAAIGRGEIQDCKSVALISLYFAEKSQR